MDIKQLAAQSLGEFKVLAEELSRLKGFKLNSVVGLVRIAIAAVKRAEEIGLISGLKGVEKQAFAMELLLQTVKLPWWVPQSLVRDYLPALIDVVVDALKDKFGK
jgi:hypothetical protein